MSVPLLLVGGGRMGEALLSGLLAAGATEPSSIVVVEKVEARRAELSGKYPGVDVVGQYLPCESAVVAVKPPDVEAACRALAAAGVRRVLSIAAGVPLHRIEEWVGDGVAVVRSMPNTPALVGAGAAAIAPGQHANEEDLAWAERLLLSVGTVERVPEGLLDAVTGLSGSGPAYVFLVAEALIDAGVAVGLPRPTAVALTHQTLLGAARLLADSGDTAEALRAAVTSPGGTTAAGLRALEDRAVRGAFMAAVEAATARSKALGAR